MNPIKLAIIRSSHSPLDTDAYNIQEIGLAKGLTDFNVSTDIYSRFSNIDGEKLFYQQNSCKITLIPIKGIAFLGRITFFKGLIKKLVARDYDIVQVHEDSQLMTPLILKACKKAGIKTVLYQGMYCDYTGKSKIYQNLLDYFFQASIKKNSDVILSKTETAKAYIEKKGYQNIHVLPIGLDFNKPLNQYKSIDIIKDFKSKFEKTLLYVGKVEERRNPFFIVEVLYTLKFQRKKNIGLVVVGNGPLKKEIIKMAIEKGVIDNIHFIDKIPNSEIHEVYKSCDLLLLPTNNEIYGMVVLESLYFGTPVIATPEAGPLSILTNNKLGYCAKLELELWLDKIIDLLDNNSPETKNYRSNYISNNYNWKSISSNYYQYIFPNEDSSNQ